MAKTTYKKLMAKAAIFQKKGESTNISPPAGAKQIQEALKRSAATLFSSGTARARSRCTTSRRRERRSVWKRRLRRMAWARRSTGVVVGTFERRSK